MKVILLGELRGKGGEGDVVDVAQGYAENYLFRNKIAQPATPRGCALPAPASAAAALPSARPSASPTPRPPRPRLTRSS